MTRPLLVVPLLAVALGACAEDESLRGQHARIAHARPGAGDAQRVPEGVPTEVDIAAAAAPKPVVFLHSPILVAAAPRGGPVFWLDPVAPQSAPPGAPQLVPGLGAVLRGAATEVP